MIRNFEEVKSQLAELFEVVNKFKSEAVQLRIVELVFTGATVSGDEERPGNAEPDVLRKRAKKRRATVGAVVEHCKIKARNFKNNELSGPLGRLVRDNQLSRTTSAEKQYEYIRK